mmetsp:Transcript_48228/g.160789  ORF Transcript_48228/g.160789 Transcript_48228/m.160789 type:complete len:226 (+) Transcript_48228:1018-1695(+)
MWRRRRRATGRCEEGQEARPTRLPAAPARRKRRPSQFAAPPAALPAALRPQLRKNRSRWLSAGRAAPLRWLRLPPPGRRRCPQWRPRLCPRRCPWRRPSQRHRQGRRRAEAAARPARPLPQAPPRWGGGWAACGAAAPRGASRGTSRRRRGARRGTRPPSAHRAGGRQRRAGCAPPRTSARCGRCPPWAWTPLQRSAPRQGASRWCGRRRRRRRGRCTPAAPRRS